MDKFFVTALILIVSIYASACFFVWAAAESEVEIYCKQFLMEQEDSLSQRNVACKFRKYR